MRYLPVSSPFVQGFVVVEAEVSLPLLSRLPAHQFSRSVPLPSRG